MPLNFTSLIPDEEDEQQPQKPWMRSRTGAQQADDMGYSIARAENGTPPVQPQPSNGNGPLAMPQQKSVIHPAPTPQIGPPAPASAEPAPDMTIGQPTQTDQMQQFSGLIPQIKTAQNA